MPRFHYRSKSPAFLGLEISSGSKGSHGEMGCRGNTSSECPRAAGRISALPWLRCCGEFMSSELMNKFYLSACAIVKDEVDLPEWVAYQFLIGFEHVHIYDNGSSTPVAITLKKWIADGKVTTQTVSGKKLQCMCYSRFLQRIPSKWAAFIDPDEFLLPHRVDDIRTFLEGFESYGGVGITWKVFGSNGHLVRPGRLVIESYTKTSIGFIDVKPRNNEKWPQYKTIAQPARAIKFTNPHYATYRPGFYAVNEKTQRLPSHSHGPPSVDSIQINHYFVKSAEDFHLKQKRRGGGSNRSRKAGDWTHVEKYCNTLVDDRIQRFLPKVKELLEEYA